MRVAIVLYGESISGGGGAERRFIRLWRFLRSQRRDVHLVANGRLAISAKAAGLLDDVSQPALHVISDRPGIPASMSTYKLLRELRIDVVHLVLSQRALVPLYLLLAINRKLRVSHTVALSHFSVRGRVRLGTLVVSRLIWHIAHAIDSLYAGFVEAYAKPHGLADKVFVSPCSFTDGEQFRPLKKSDNVIVFAGRLIEEKGPLLFLDALRILESRSTPEWRAVIAGGGPLKHQVVARASELQHPSRVQVVELPKMNEVLGTSRIFASLQRTENYPSQALLEAMHAENAIVATNVGETARLVRHGQTGLLVERSPEALADAIELLLVDRDLAARLGGNARQFVEQYHRVADFAAHINNVWLAAFAR